MEIFGFSERRRQIFRQEPIQKHAVGRVLNSFNSLLSMFGMLRWKKQQDKSQHVLKSKRIPSTRRGINKYQELSQKNTAKVPGLPPPTLDVE